MQRKGKKVLAQPGQLPINTIVLARLEMKEIIYPICQTQPDCQTQTQADCVYWEHFVATKVTEYVSGQYFAREFPHLLVDSAKSYYRIRYNEQLATGVYDNLIIIKTHKYTKIFVPTEDIFLPNQMLLSHPWLKHISFWVGDQLERRRLTPIEFRQYFGLDMPEKRIAKTTTQPIKRQASYQMLVNEVC